MTTELEHQFFDTFEIKPKYKTCVFKYCKNKKEYDCENCNDREWHYPQITDRHYLELMCLLSGYCQTKHACNYQTYSTTMDCFKKEILEDFITHYETFDDFKECKHQVQTLFEV